MDAGTVLLSGGLDSTVLLHHVVKTFELSPVYAVSFRYGQKHSRELGMAAWQAAQVPQVAAHDILDLTGLGENVTMASTLVAGGADIPDLAQLSDAERRQPPTYVPNRNMILLALGAALAECRDCRRLFYGAQAHDQYGYWDCTAEFVRRMNDTLALNPGCAVRIEAPFVAESKADVVRLGLALGVDFAHTWSCYRGGDQPCGTCPTCVERCRAFTEAGVPDPLESATAP